jgi:hypothetical protein
MARYYIADLHSRCGEYSFIEHVRFVMREPERDFFNTPEECAYQNAEKFCDDLAKFWYDYDEEGGIEEDENWYSFNGGEVAVKYGFHKEITKETFDDLHGTISDHTSWELRKELNENK